jgi:hypothetical protein
MILRLRDFKISKSLNQNSLNPSHMPIEVRELVIKAVVTQDNANGASGGGASQGSGAQEDIIQACVEKVMDILKEKNER